MKASKDYGSFSIALATDVVRDGASLPRCSGLILKTVLRLAPLSLLAAWQYLCLEICPSERLCSLVVITE